MSAATEHRYRHQTQRDTAQQSNIQRPSQNAHSASYKPVVNNKKNLIFPPNSFYIKPVFPQVCCSQTPFGFEKQPRNLTPWSSNYSVLMIFIQQKFISEMILDSYEHRPATHVTITLHGVTVNELTVARFVVRKGFLIRYSNSQSK
jgi:hypothetical protein